MLELYHRGGAGAFSINAKSGIDSFLTKDIESNISATSEMSNIPKILSVDPAYSIPGGEITVNCSIEGFEPDKLECLFDGKMGGVSAASSNRILVRVPDGCDAQEVDMRIVNGDLESERFVINVGQPLCGDMHIVANPAVDPNDGSVIVTRSGTRGQKLQSTLFRVREGISEEMSADVLNPTGVAFDRRGRLFVTNRADGEVCQINDDTEALPIATDLGVATGIVFGKDDTMFVGDRNGSVYKISALGDARVWASLEPSVSAYHMAFGADDDLFVAAPGLASYDVIHKIGADGVVSVFYKGLGRPQGIAFDDDGNLYVAACLKGRHGIVKIGENGAEASLFIAGMGIVGLCFDGSGGLIVATADALYRLKVGLLGTLLDQ